MGECIALQRPNQVPLHDDGDGSFCIFCTQRFCKYYFSEAVELEKCDVIGVGCKRNSANPTANILPRTSFEHLDFGAVCVSRS